MTANKIATDLIDRFEASGKHPVTYRKEDTECSLVSILFPWRYSGKVHQVSLLFSITDKGIVATASVCNEHDVDVYIGAPLPEAAYTEVIQWLWRYFSVGICEDGA